VRQEAHAYKSKTQTVPSKQLEAAHFVGFGFGVTYSCAVLARFCG
jgi:hypothetical protein